jgi:hypothetical protein
MNRRCAINRRLRWREGFIVEFFFFAGALLVGKLRALLELRQPAEEEWGHHHQVYQFGQQQECADNGLVGIVNSSKVPSCLDGFYSEAI